MNQNEKENIENEKINDKVENLNTEDKIIK